MMRGSSLVGGLVFGALAALASIPWTMVTAPLLGRPWAVAAFCLGAAVLYTVWTAPTWARGLRIGALAGLLAIAVVGLASWPTEAILGAALILAVARSGFSYRGAPARALVLEGILAIGGLVFAAALAGPTLLSTAVGVWSFFLLQSLFFLVGGTQVRETDEPRIDPFDRARQRALTLMEDA